MKRNIALALGAGLFLGSACATSASLTTRGALVKVVDEAALHADCNPIRDVKVQGKTPEAATMLLRNKAGTLNAKAVVIRDSAETPSGVVLSAMAYGCPDGKM